MPLPRYSILLPPGWVRIPLDDTTDAAFAELIDGAVARAPIERRAQLRGLIQSSTDAALAAARAQHAADFILSLATIDGLPIPASIATFKITPDASLGSSPEQILVSFASPGSRAVEIDGVAAIRRVKESPATEDAPAHRGVHFVLQHPGTREWMLISASLLMSEGVDLTEVLDALEFLIDSMVSTIRFEREDAAV